MGSGVSLSSSRLGGVGCWSHSLGGVVSNCCRVGTLWVAQGTPSCGSQNKHHFPWAGPRVVVTPSPSKAPGRSA